jgi:serine/threonine protein kinase
VTQGSHAAACACSPCFTARSGRQVALDVAEALDHLHTQQGILHSDLKPL